MTIQELNIAILFPKTIEIDYIYFNEKSWFSSEYINNKRKYRILTMFENEVSYLYPKNKKNIEILFSTSYDELINYVKTEYPEYLKSAERYIKNLKANKPI